MDRWRAAGALLALAACIACSAAAPTASNHTALDLYEGSPEGCYYNFQHYGEGDRIMTNEPCLNCTCHNRMLMCYLRVCPFTKAIGQDCTVEKRADQCCPIVTCPDVPVDLLTSTSTSSPAEYGATGLGKLDKYGCSIHGKYFPEGSKVPPTPNKPCEHCYCIRNMTTCVMQECTLHVDGCTPIYHKDVCCPVRYSCDHPEDEMPLLDDMSTTVRPTPGFLLTTTTMSPVTQMTQDCVHNDQVIADGASITTEKACEHCYCMKGDIVCVVQECGAPMENEGKNCTSMPPREGQCCPDTYICEGDGVSTEIPTESSTDSIVDNLTTLTPPRRGGIEGSGYRHEPNEAVHAEATTAEAELEGSGEEEAPTKATDTYEPLIPGKPLQPEEMTPNLEDSHLYIPVTTKAPTFVAPETTTLKFDESSILDETQEKGTIEQQTYLPITHAPVEDVDRITDGLTGDKELTPHKHVTMTVTSVTESYETVTPESVESLNTVPDVHPVEDKEKAHEYTPIPTSIAEIDESETTTLLEKQGTKGTPSGHTMSPVEEGITYTDNLTPSPVVPEFIEKETTEKSESEADHITDEEISPTESYFATTGFVAVEDSGTFAPHKESQEIETTEDKYSSTPEKHIPSTTSSSIEDIEKQSTEPDHAQNTVAVAEEGHDYTHIPSSEEAEKTTSADFEGSVTEKVTRDEHREHTTIIPSVLGQNEAVTTEPDKGLNTIPSEIDEESSSQQSLVDKTTLSLEAKSTEPSVVVHVTEPQDVDTKLSSPASESQMPLETHVTKGDQYTITTEPSFRREDEIRPTEKPKEEHGPTTIKAEFVDEGFIPTSTHDEKTGPGSDVPTIDEEITTILPEYSQGLEETIDSKYPSTESVLGISVVSETILEQSTEQESKLPSSTEKSAEVTVLTPDVDIHEGPSRIPGEGDCLLNGITYRNNTVVPSTNNCQTGCKCVSSIMKCDHIICSPPPDYMDNNCQSIYDTPDSCCPTYVCDHPKETIPPPSDSHISVTEPPVPPPVIECRGDQCELSEPTKPPTDSSELCTSGDCLHAAHHKPEISECGPEGCVSDEKEPISSHPSVEPSVEKPGCIEGKCAPTLESCANGECPLLPTHGQGSPTKPCEGDDCEVTGEEIPSPQLCENEDECKKQEVPVTQTVPCEGEACINVDCGSNGCVPGVILSPQDSQQIPCSKKDGCTGQEITPSDCTGNAPCRRKDVPGEEPLPSKCEDGDCVQETDKTESEQDHHLSSESPIQEPLEVATEKIEPSDSPIYSPDTQIISEKEHIPTEHTIYETSELGKDSEVTQKASESQDIVTDEPTTKDEKDTKKPILPEQEEPIDAQATESPFVITDEGTEKPSAIQEVTKKPDTIDEEQSDVDKSTKIPDGEVDKQADKPEVTVEVGTKIPDFIGEQTSMPGLDEEKVTKLPDFGTEKQTSKPVMIDEDNKMPDDEVKDHTDKPVSSGEKDTKIIDVQEGYTDEPAGVEEIGTKTPDFIVEVETSKPALDGEKETKVPDSVVEDQTSKLDLVKEEGTKMPEVVVEQYSEKPALVEEEGTRVSDVVVEDQTDKTVPDKEKDTMFTDIEEGYTDEPAIVEETGTNIPEAIEEEQSSKPPIVKEEDTITPGEPVEAQTAKPAYIEETGTKMTDDVIDKYTSVPALVEEESTKMPHIVVEEHTSKPVLVKEEDAKMPDVVEKEHTHKPALIEEEGTKAPEVAGEAQTDKSALFEQVTKIPDVVEEHTDKYVPAGEKDTKITDITETYTDEPDVLGDTGTETPDVVVEEETSKPALVDDQNTEIPDIILEQQTSKPDAVKEEGEKIPDVVVEEQTRKPSLDGVEHTKVPDSVVEKETSKPELLEKEGTMVPDVVVETQTDKTSLVEEEGTKVPDVVVETQTDETALVEEEGTKIPDVSVEEHSDKPALVEKEGTMVPDVDGEDGTSKPALAEEEGTKMPDAIVVEQTSKPILGEEQGTKTPDVVEEDHTAKPVSVEDESTTITDISAEKHTDKPSLVEEESTKAPDGAIKEEISKPTFVTEEGTKMPDFIVEDLTTKPGLVEEEGTKTPDIAVETQTSEPALVEKEATKVPDVAVEKETIKPALVEEEGTKRPDVIVDVHTDKPALDENEGTIVPDVVVETQTDEPAVVEEEDTKVPDVVVETQTDEPALVEEEGTKLPDVSVEEHTGKLGLVEKEGTKVPDVFIEEGTSKPTLVEEEGTKMPDVIVVEQTSKPILGEEEDTKTPDVVEEDHTVKPDSVDDEGTKAQTKIPDSSAEEHTDKPSLVEEAITKAPDVAVEEETSKATFVTEEGTKMPDFIVEDLTAKPASAEEGDTKTPDIAVEIQTSKPALDEKEGTKVPDVDIEEETIKPALVEGEGTKMPDVITDVHTSKSPLDENEGTKVPDVVVETPTDKPTLVEEEGTKIPDVVVETQTDEPAVIEEEGTKIPEVSLEEHTSKPGLVEKLSTEKPYIEKEHSETPGLAEQESTTGHTIPDGVGTEIPEPIEVYDTKKPIIIDESTAAPAEIEEDKETKSPIAIQEGLTDSSVVTDDKIKQKPAKIDEGAEEPATEEISPTLVEKEHVGEPQISETTTKTPEQSDQYEHKVPEDEGTLPTEPTKEVKVPESSVEGHLEVTDSNLGKATKSPIYESQTTKTPESFETTETVEIATKSTEPETINEQGEIYTDMPEQDLSVTKSPVDAIIEPQDAGQSVSTDITGSVEQESSSEGFEKDIGSVAPDSYVTAFPEYAVTSAVPGEEIVGITESAEVTDAEKQKTEIPEPHDIESGKVPTKSPEDISEQKIKTDQPEIFTPEKEEMITSTVGSAMTEPVKGFTEIEDSFVTGQGEATTKQYEESTDNLESSVTKQTDLSSDISTQSSEAPLLSDTKATKVPEESYTASHELHTEAPVMTETLSTEVHVPHEPEMTTGLSTEIPLVTVSTELPEKSPESGKPMSGDKNLSTEILESDTKPPIESATTELPISVETESQKSPLPSSENVTSQEEKTTKTPDTSSVPEMIVPVEQASTELPESHITASLGAEQSKPTESTYEVQQQDIDLENTTPSVTKKPDDIKTQAPELIYSDADTKKHPAEEQKTTEYATTFEEMHTELPHIQVATEGSLSLVTEKQKPATTVVEDMVTEKHDTKVTEQETHTESQDEITEKPQATSLLLEVTTSKYIEEATKSADQTSTQPELAETTSYLIELEEHTHKTVEDISSISPTGDEEHLEDIGTPSPIEEDYTHKTAQEITTPSSSEDEDILKLQGPLSTVLPSVDHTHKVPEDTSTVLPSMAESTSAQPETEVHSSEATTEKITGEEIETDTKQTDVPSEPSVDSGTIAVAFGDQTTLSTPQEVSQKLPESSDSTETIHIEETTVVGPVVQDKYDFDQKDITTAKHPQDSEITTPAIFIDTEKSPISESGIIVPTEKESLATQKPSHPHIHASHTTTIPKDEIIRATTEATTVKEEEMLTPVHEEKYDKNEEKPTNEISPPSTTAELAKPPAEISPQPTEEISPTDDDGHFPQTGAGYGEPDYVEEDQAFGPGTCRYGGKVYVSAQQIPRDDPCDFCFCFRSDIICLQQSCPPPIHGCHEEPIQGFCCPRYECPVSMATTVNVTTTTTTTTTTLPPHFPTHSYKGAAQRRGCQIKGHTYKVGEVVRSSSGPCLHCTCGGDGQMKCDPKACTPEPMLRQMIAAAVSAKRRR